MGSCWEKQRQQLEKQYAPFFQELYSSQDSNPLQVMDSQQQTRRDRVTEIKSILIEDLNNGLQLLNISILQEISSVNYSEQSFEQSDIYQKKVPKDVFQSSKLRIDKYGIESETNSSNFM
ncbi:hypothetical protein SS50377_26119 [Spironucleus salmonicida]|uniref:Uncharacterized protein n=1 Tax=Spironucleus salmonicida TaxID=348837 RepID=V6LNZ7_9EUKA|nr:hypothetical protein SS50377_26119 [Spironucleus salmonicida]|eukprot:EST46325.1 Hypothetical protein SS50377_13636 [Spironucleus salmonicida]